MRNSHVVERDTCLGVNGVKFEIFKPSCAKLGPAKSIFHFLTPRDQVVRIGSVELIRRKIFLKTKKHFS